MLPQGLCHHPQMINMFLPILRIDKDVIYEHHNKLIQIGSEDPIHKIHESCEGIGEAKQHYCKLIMTILGPKHCVGDVFRFNPKMMVP